MFGNNAFGALAMDQSAPQAGPSTRQVDGEEVDADWIKLIKTNHDVYVRVSEKLDLQGLPDECNLMAVSNTWGLVIVGGSSDIRIHRLTDIHNLLENSPKDALPISTPIRILPLPARPIWIRLAMNEERLVVATKDGNGVCLFRLKDVLGGDTSPYHTFTSDLPRHLTDLLPNPAPPSPSDSLSRYVTLLAKEGFVIADIEDCKLSSPLAGIFTSGCWSAKGKQIVVGTQAGDLVQYTPEGTPKAQIPAPPELDSESHYYPSFIRWLENDLFLVCYAQANGASDDPLEVFVIHRQKGAFTYTKYYDLVDTMGSPGRSGVYRHFAGLKQWGDRTKHLGFLISGLASEIGVMHGGLDDDGQPKWEVCILDETARGVMPAAKKGITDDTSVLALELDLTSEKVIQRGIEGGVELPDLPPAPRLLAYSQEGLIISFNVIYPDGGAYPGMVQPQDITGTSSVAAGQEEAMDTGTGANTPAPSEAPKPAFGGGAYGQSSFGSTTTPTKAPAFGSSAFGQSATPATPAAPAFGSSSKPVAFGASAFGQPSAFGSTTPTTTPATKSSGFGQSAFGQSTTPSSTPSAFGQSSSTPSAFGHPSNTSAFGQSSTPSAFGQTSKPGFGSSAFGQPASSPSPAAFGQSVFGQPAKPASSPSPGFGASSTPSTSAFGGFGAKPTSTPAFGTSAFGQPAASPSAEPKKEASPFGSTTAPTAPTAPSAFGSSAFGASSSSAFGSTAFGAKPAVEGQSAFGGFGKPASPSPAAATPSAFAGFGSKPTSGPPQSAFTGFGSAKTSGSAFASTPANSDSAPSPAGGNHDFGMGGFASALGESTKTGVPGLEESPPGSPILQGTKKPSGLDDDETPPNSPPPVSQPLKPTATPSTASPSVIKPATAFGGGAASGAWGAFGQGPKSGVAFGAPSTSAATPLPPSSSTPKATTGTAFGQNSTPASGSAFGQPARPAQPGALAFGTPTAFGQSSKPGGFGQTSTPAAPASFGNITGGFGSFAAKPSASPSGDSKAATGFGGFAKAFTSNSPTSPFGEKSTQSSFANLLSGEKKDALEKSSPAIKQEDKTDDVPSLPPTETTSPKPETPSPTKQAAVKEEEENEEEPQSTRVVVKPAEDEENEKPATGSSVPPSALETGDHRRNGQISPPSSEEGVLVEDDGEGQTEGEEAIAEDENGSQDEEEQYEEEYTEEDYEDEYEEDYEDEEEGGEEDDEAEEKADEEEEADAGRARRRSSSIAPDMSPIREEPGEELEEEEEEGSAQPVAVKTPKSPPTWFAKTNTTKPAAPSEQPDTTPSLFSRLGPPPTSNNATTPTPVAAPVPIAAAQKLPPSFNLRHAARTSSPLGTQPPQTGTSTPPESPAKPAQKDAPTFSFFGPKPEGEKKSASPSFFGDSASTALEAKPALGFGLGKPPSAAKPSTSPAAQTSPFSFTGFGQSQQSQAVQSPAQATTGARSPSPVQGYDVPVPKQQPAAPAPTSASSSFTVPPRPTVAPVPQSHDDAERSMAAVLQRMISSLLADIQSLKNVLDANSGYHRALEVPNFVKVTAAGLDAHKALPFSSIADVKVIVDDLAAQLDDIRANSSASELKLSDLQSRLLKSDMKVGQAEKFLKARQDPSFARVMQVKDLSPEQAASQTKLRKAAQTTETRLTELEAGIAGLKKRLERRESTRHANNSPALDRVQRSVRNVDAAIRDRAATIDDLSERISSIRLATPSKSRSRSETTVPLTPSRDSPSVPPSAPVSFEPPQEVWDEVEKSLDRQAGLKARLAGRKVLRLTTIDTASGSGNKGGILNHSSLINGPVMIDAIPLPGIFSPSTTITTTAAVPKAEPPTPSTSTTPAGPPSPAPVAGFGSLKFTLDPGDIVLTSSSSRTRATGGSTRSHAPAAKFTGSTSITGPAPVTNLSFTPPSELSAAASRDAPSGFFSFSGYGNK